MKLLIQVQVKDEEDGQILVDYVKRSLRVEDWALTQDTIAELLTASNMAHKLEAERLQNLGP